MHNTFSWSQTIWEPAIVNTGPGNEWGLWNKLGAQRAEQFPHLGNYTLTSVQTIHQGQTVEKCDIIKIIIIISVYQDCTHTTTITQLTYNKLSRRTGMVQLRRGPCVTTGSHSFTCHPCMNHTFGWYSLHLPYPRRDGQAELTRVAGHIPG